MPLPFYVPVSAFRPFYDTPVAFHGTRTGARPIALTVRAMVTEGDANASLLDAPAPSGEQTYTICVRFCDWTDVEPPQAEDEVRFMPDGVRTQTLHVSSVKPQLSLGHFEIVARTRGGLK